MSTYSPVIMGVKQAFISNSRNSDVFADDAVTFTEPLVIDGSRDTARRGEANVTRGHLGQGAVSGDFLNYS